MEKKGFTLLLKVVCVVVMCVRARQGNREKKTYIKSLNYLICVCERKRKRERESESKIDREREREKEQERERRESVSYALMQIHCLLLKICIII